MSIEWITPKTNWVSTDYINFQDYNRIRNNLLFLRRMIYSMANVVYKDMVVKESYADYPYADELNAIEDNLEALNNCKYALKIGVKETYEDNSLGWNYAELNRIESACISIYELVMEDRRIFPLLEFRLGRGGNFRA